MVKTEEPASAMLRHVRHDGGALLKGRLKLRGCPGDTWTKDKEPRILCSCRPTGQSKSKTKIANLMAKSEKYRLAVGGNSTDRRVRYFRQTFFICQVKRWRRRAAEIFPGAAVDQHNLRSKVRYAKHRGGRSIYRLLYGYCIGIVSGVISGLYRPWPI